MNLYDGRIIIYSKHPDAKFDPEYNVFSLLRLVFSGYNPFFDYENDHIGRK